MKEDVILTVFECIAEYVCNYSNISSTVIEDAINFEHLRVAVESYISGKDADVPFRLEEHTTGEIVGTWDSLTAFINSNPSNDLLAATVHTQFDHFDKYDDFAGNVWLI